MERRAKLTQLFLVSSGLFLGSLNPVQMHAQAFDPSRILVCESRQDACKQPDAHLDIVWTFNGAEGTASSAANPGGSHLTIEKLDKDSIVVRRVDQAGPTAGLTALYTGTINGAHISGTVQWSWTDHPGYPANGTFAAVLQDQPAAEQPTPATQSVATSDVLPPELLVCENNGSCNAAWTIHGTEGTAYWYDRKVTRAKLTVLRSAKDDILIHRTDITDGVSANYAGSWRGDHYSGVIIWSTSSYNVSTGTWTATVPQTTCDPQAQLDPSDALRIGQNALMFHRDKEALSCYIVAAKAGDATAQVAVGLTYYQGRPNIPQDYTQAFFWLHKAADQGVYAAQRTVAEMYAAGQGTQRDPTLAKIYTARADEQKHDLERRQDLADREADRRAQVLSSFVLGASFGAFLFF